MKTLIYIFLGGGTGSIIRYLIQVTINRGITTPFPLGTYTVNLLGSLLIGVFYSLADKLDFSVETRLLLTIGLCGGFTTFSTFSTENLNLIKEGLYGTLLLYTLSSITLGIIFVFIGAWIAKYI